MLPIHAYMATAQMLWAATLATAKVASRISTARQKSMSASLDRAIMVHVLTVFCRTLALAMLVTRTEIVPRISMSAARIRAWPLDAA